MKNIKEKVEKAIKNFNSRNSPFSIAEIISISTNVIKVSFSGYFLERYNKYDTFENFKIILEEEGIKSEIENVSDEENESIVTFRF